MTRVLATVITVTVAGDPPFAVHPAEQVTDLEELCRGVIAAQTLALKQPLAACDFDESLAELLARSVVIARKYRRQRGILFRPWLYQRLEWALIDFWRAYYGRHGEKRVADTGGPRDIDGEAEPFDHGAAGLDQPDRAPAADQVADGAAGALPREWVDLSGDRAPGGAVGGLGVREGRGDSAGAGDGRAEGEDPARSRSAPVPIRAVTVDCACGWRSYLGSDGERPDWCAACGAALLPEFAPAARQVAA